MKRTLRWSSRAHLQLADTALYLERKRTGAGESFLSEVDHLAQVAAKTPLRFPKVPGIEGEIRRALVKRYGYWLIFEMTRSEVFILSVWSSRRDPEGWRDLH